MNAQLTFSVSADIAERTGLTEVRYRTEDGRYILTDKDLARLTLTPEEYMHGIDVILLTEEEAGRLIAEGGFNVGGQPARTTVGETPEDTVTEPVAEVAAPQAEETSSSSSEEDYIEETEQNNEEEE